MELIDHMPVTRRDGKLIVGEGVKFERIRRITGLSCRHGGSVQQRQTSGSERPCEACKDELSEKDTREMMDQDRIIERIRKLLHLSQSANPHEAALAAQRVQQMLSEYNLTMDSIGCDALNSAAPVASMPQNKPWRAQ